MRILGPWHTPWTLDITKRANHFVIFPTSSGHQSKIIRCMSVADNRTEDVTGAQVIDLTSELLLLTVSDGHVYLRCILYCWLPMNPPENLELLSRGLTSEHAPRLPISKYPLP